MAKVLVIEDDDLVRGAIARMLRSYGHEAVEAADGSAGLAALQRHDPALVITDVVMPGRDGIATISDIRTVSGLPIIAISGFQRGGAFDPLRDADLLGADITITKPFTGEELLAAVEELLSVDQ